MILGWNMKRRECFEAKVVKALDAMECMLQVLEYRKGEMFAKHVTFTVTYGTKHASIDPFLAKLADYIAAQMQAHYKEFKQ
jgi:hypothetical protein